MSNEFIGKLRDHFGTLEGNPAVDPELMLCTTIEGHSDGDGDPFWIQLHAAQVNFPHRDEPAKDEWLDALLEELDVIADIETGSYVTFDIVQLSSGQLDALLLRLTREYFGSTGLHEMTISTEEF